MNQFIFTPENWNVPQTVTLAAPQDDDDLDGAESVYHFVSGGGYTGDPNVQLKVTIADDDEAGLALSPAALAMDEGTTAAYTVALKTRPAGNVRVKLFRSSYGIHFRPHVNQFTFTPENWNVPRSVTVSAPQDLDTLDGAETVYHFVTGGGYSGDPNVQLKVTIADDDATVLESLTLDGIALNEAFDPGRTSYTATVDRQEVRNGNDWRGGE